ncbi:MAG: aminodeoxychorismate lyase [Gammaproteobacteria bacterium]|nr:MAG: aminodeoxychorismate lyase [Gammaproteobacteria bacterium]
MILVNGQPENRINISDRGLQYGDGLFETIAYRNGTAEFLDAHLARLVLGCERLSIAFHQLEKLRDELDLVCQYLATNDAVMKIIVTRCSGGRGYFTDNTVEPTRIISTHSFPNDPDNYKITGVALICCQQNLAENTTLAGIKHLNRLEQVLARNEWNTLDVTEGLMFDNHGNLIEGTMSNVFFVKSGLLYTPDLSKAGVAGIMRAEILRIAQKEGMIVEEVAITKTELATMDEVFICNSVIGIWPVIQIDDIIYPIGNITKRLQNALLQTK